MAYLLMRIVIRSPVPFHHVEASEMRKTSFILTVSDRPVLNSTISMVCVNMYCRWQRLTCKQSENSQVFFVKINSDGNFQLCRSTEMIIIEASWQTKTHENNLPTSTGYFGNEVGVIVLVLSHSRWVFDFYQIISIRPE
jgi:hypothetical protein